MFIEGSVLRVQFPAFGNSSPLFKCTVVEAVSDSVQVKFSEPIDAPSKLLGEIAFIHCEVYGQFQRTPARVQAYLKGGARPIFRLTTRGEFEPAEQRDSKRFHAAATNLVANLRDEAHCMVTDISSDGFSIATACQFHEGQKIDVELVYGAESYVGRAWVRNVRDMPDHTFRYGLQPVAADGELQRGLQFITLFIQREHLRRMRHLP